MMLRPVTWIPFLIVSAAQFIVLLFLVSFHRPLILPLGLPLVERLGGEAVTHYPILYYALPDLFSRVNLVVAALIASVAGGAATLLFAHFWGMGQRKGAWARSLRAAPNLIPLTLLTIGLLFGIGALIRLVPRELILGNSIVRWGTRAGLLATYIVIESLFGYTTAWVVLMGHWFLPALRDSIKVTRITLLPTLLVVALPAVLLFPITYATSRVDLIVDKLRPETTFGLISIQIVMELFCTFLLAAALVRLFVWRMEASR